MDALYTYLQAYDVSFLARCNGQTILHTLRYTHEIPALINFSFIFFPLILDVFDNKTKGIFTILNDECAFPSIENFANKLKNAWIKDKTSPISWNICCQKTNQNDFLIRHFVNDVTYSTVCLF